MAWWSRLFDFLGGAKDLAEVFTENKEGRARRTHEAHMGEQARARGTLDQYAAEFHHRQGRGWWDALVDGLNRLPRPLIALGTLSFFVLAPVDPERFSLIAEAYARMPEGFWALLSVVVAFYFGGRMQVKAQDMKRRDRAVLRAEEDFYEQPATRPARERVPPPPGRHARAASRSPTPQRPQATEAADDQATWSGKTER